MSATKPSHGLPIDFFKAQRRELAERWRQDSGMPPSKGEIEEMAVIQATIEALEAVREEISSEPAFSRFSP